MANCKYCGESGLRWEQTDAGWRLVQRSGDRHVCGMTDEDRDEEPALRKDLRSPAPKADQVLDYEDKIGTCKTCRYFHDYAADTLTVGQCRANSPAPALEVGSGTVCWPEMDYTDWCGDYREKRATQEGGR